MVHSKVKKSKENKAIFTQQFQNRNMEVKDSNGNILQNGDSVTIIKSLDVKGSNLNLKQGTRVKNIKLTDNEEEVDCRIEGQRIVLKACFLKKS
jgi:protein PhnA